MEERTLGPCGDSGLWSCFSLPPAPSLQLMCEWRGKEESELVSLQAFTSASSLGTTSAATAVVIHGEDAQGRSRDGKRDRGTYLSSIPHSCSDWLCTSAEGAEPGFHPQRPKQQTRNVLIQVHDALCPFLSLLVSSPHAPWFSTHFSLQCFHPLHLILGLYTAGCKMKFNCDMIYRAWALLYTVGVIY